MTRVRLMSVQLSWRHQWLCCRWLVWKMNTQLATAMCSASHW